MTAQQDPVDSTFAPSWLHPGIAAPNLATRIPLGPDAGRLWTHFMRARVFVALLLVALEAFAWLHGRDHPLLAGLCVAYTACTLAALRLPPPSPNAAFWSGHWAATVWLDLVVFAVLQWFQGASLNTTPLLAVPVLTAAFLGSLSLALGSAAAATLAVLGQSAWLELSTQTGTSLAQSSLTGTGFFLLALLAKQLAVRLSREQELARHSLAEAQTHSAANELIASGLSEGILVLDAHGTLWHANTAALDMLGLPGTQPEDLAHLPLWPELQAWAMHCLMLQQEQEREWLTGPAEGLPRKLHVRAKPSAPATGGDVCVLFLEDLREVEARIRNAKLAAMGRVTAAVAHEIRNPLAAITQANALLAEDELPAPQQRLVGMIEHNAKRLARTVDDILNLTHVESGPTEQAPGVELAEAVQFTVQDWLRTYPQGARLVVDLDARSGPGPTVSFDAEHLQRVLTNLLDNARKHAAKSDGAIRVWMEHPSTEVSTVTVWSEGRPLEPGMQQHLFEPFFSTDSRSSGLGLYICRELCQRYRADISYQRLRSQDREGNAFVIYLRNSISPG